MTSEQRNEIAMEVLDEVLTEATRYAKEIHKKAEKDRQDIKTDVNYGASKKSLDKYRELCSSDPHINKGPVTRKLMKKYDKQGLYARSKLKNIRKDTVGIGKSIAKDEGIYDVVDGRVSACSQPGRYGARHNW